MELLNRHNSESYRPIIDRNGNKFLFTKQVNRILSDNPRISKIFDIPVKLEGYQKICLYGANQIWGVYQINWSLFKGKNIPGTPFIEGGCVNNSEDLATQVQFAFAINPQEGKVMSYTSCTFWVSDKNDFPRWRREIFQEYAATALLAD